MATAQYNFERLRQASQQLTQAQNRLDTKLTEMRNVIANMVSGDFKTTGASGTLNEAYAQFTDKASRTLETLHNTSRFLQGIVQQQQQLDGNLQQGFRRLSG
jgi:signal transduction histidine kinase